MDDIWVTEDSEFDETGFVWLGTFSAMVDPEDRCEEVPVEEAVAWALARSDEVYVRVDDGETYAAGTRNPDKLPRWPPADLPELVRRRPPGEAWKDRTDADDPIAWTVSAWLSRSPMMVDRSRDAEAAGIAERAGADGWDADELDAFIAEMEQARLEAAPSTRYGWFSTHPAAYRVRLTETAPTAARASEQGARRFDLPEGWQVECGAEPAG